MPTYDPTTEARAVRELKRQRAKLSADKDAVTAARDALQEAIVRHLRERNAPPGEVSDHTPYDRNHVGVIARNAGVKPLRVKGQPAEVPVYDPEVVAAALAELDRLTTDFTKAEERESKTHIALQAAATQHYLDNHASAQTLADASEFDRNTIMRWGREARKKAAAGAS
ncbi:hypothetical protein [Streptomyces sp. OK228]|uniref:hypothetical protein n=1 Tax=Streptomyces sp. OK228 TaxID=1882786 RepID=UPI000BC89B63|nr:hypothetical protein [Streptomyces sp. OK228]SOE31749.1 hypothetical protein SAMN05442782_8682 [Streptomyces sp. OK228]